jgi:hypothetical protein
MLLAASTLLVAGVSLAAQAPLWPAASELSLPANAQAVGSSRAGLNSVTCTSVGTCTAAGAYLDGKTFEPMVASETGGTWGAARELTLPANAAPTPNQFTTLNSVSCTSPGNCVAVGEYVPTTASGSSTDVQAMVVAEAGGVWGPASQLALPSGAASSPARQFALLGGVTCTSAGNCTAVGSYTDGGGSNQPLVETETNGNWGTGKALAPPPDAAAGAGAQLAQLLGVACTSVGNCVAVGVYADSSSQFHPMYVAETGGVWGQASKLILPADASTSPQLAGLSSVACTGPGSCEAVGSYEDTQGSGDYQAMVAAETGGVWGAAVRLKLPANIPTAPGAQNAALNSIGCTSAGNCVAVGNYNGTNSTSSQNDTEAMRATETGGAWGHAVQQTLPANATTAAGGQYAALYSVFCLDVSSCTAVGGYSDNSNVTEAMFVSSVGPLSITTTTTLPGAQLGSHYRAQLTAVGGAGGYKWGLSGGSLPVGLTLNARSGVISGTPTASGLASFTVGLSDPGPPAQTAIKSLKIKVTVPPRPQTLRPKSIISSKRHRASFAFKARGATSGFQCALVRVAARRHARVRKPHFKRCRSPKSYSHLRLGKYIFFVRASGPGGLDRTPATHKFAIT